MAEINKIINKKSERNSNIELLRILVTLFVVMLHYNNGNAGRAFTYTQNMPANYQVLLAFEMFTICAVNVFVVISGYFMCKSKRVEVTKIMRVYADVILIYAVTYLLRCLLEGVTFSLKGLIYSMIPLNWYVAIYATLYFISPYLNKVIRDMKEKQFRTMLLILIFAFSIWPSLLEFVNYYIGINVAALNTISTKGSLEGYSIVNFVLMYMCGAYIRMHFNEKKDSKTMAISLAIYIMSGIMLLLYTRVYFLAAFFYSNPLVVLQAVSLFKVFQCIDIKSKFINSMASCSFGVYLMHGFFFKYAKIEQFVTGNLLVIPVHIILTAIAIYLISAAIYKVYFFVFDPVLNWILGKFSFLTYEVE